MKKKHERRSRPARVAEPVQVYLDPADRDRLDRLAQRLEATKSDVLRRGLEALESLTRRPPGASPQLVALPTYRGQGLQPGVDLNDMASLLDLMERDAAG